jgi:tripartite-type tricarboxylate transporter receptor subunit TctC
MIIGFVRLFAALVLAVTAAGAALAQSFPSKPVHIVVPFPAGGPNDFFGRVLGNKLTALLGQPIVIENRPGASGVTGTEFVAKSAPDGYMLILTSSGSTAIAPAISDVPYDPQKDLATITLVAKVPEVLVAIPKLNVKTLPELITYIKANPGKVNFASSGSGGMPHLAGELLKREAGLNMTHIPYRGAAPAVNDLLGGHVEIMFADIPVLLAHIQAGTLTALALGSAARTPILPDVPTTGEAGQPNVLADNWYGLFAPAATPKEVIAKLHQTVIAALRDADLQEQFKKQGAAASPMSPEEFSAFLRTESVKWGGLAKAVGAKID